jgi:hypothetical protein
MDNLIYLDPGFIAMKYEELEGVSGDTQFSRTEGGKADVGFSFAKAGVHTQETTTFKKSSVAMLRELMPKLERAYAPSDLANFKNFSGTQYAWVEGDMSVQSWSNSEDPNCRYDYYGLKIASRKLALISVPSYFSSGFSEVIKASDALVGYVRIPVRALVRVLWHIEKTGEYISVPYLVVEQDAS